MDVVCYEQKKVKLSCYNVKSLSEVPHFHLELEMIVCFSGKVNCFLSGQNFDFGAGDIVLVYPNQVHNYRMIEDGEFLIIIFYPELIPNMTSYFKSYDPSTGKFKNNANNQIFIDAFTYEQSLVDKKLASREHSQNFLGGEYGMIFFGDFDLKANGRLKEMAPSEIGAVPLPTSYKGKTLEYNLGGGRGYGVARGSKNPEGAYYVLRYFLDVNNYIAEGVNVFANKALEGYYVNTMLPQYKAANKRCINYTKQPCLLIDKYFDSTREPWVDMFAASSDQAATELKKVSGIFDSAVSAANKTLAEYK